MKKGKPLLHPSTATPSLDRRSRARSQGYAPYLVRNHRRPESRGTRAALPFPQPDPVNMGIPSRSHGPALAARVALLSPQRLDLIAYLRSFQLRMARATLLTFRRPTLRDAGFHPNFSNPALGSESCTFNFQGRNSRRFPGLFTPNGESSALVPPEANSGRRRISSKLSGPRLPEQKLHFCSRGRIPIAYTQAFRAERRKRSFRPSGTHSGGRRIPSTFFKPGVSDKKGGNP